MALEIQTQKSLALAPLIGAAIGAAAEVLYGYTGALPAVLFWTVVPRLIGEPFLRGPVGRIVLVLSILVEWQLLRLAVGVHDPMMVCIAAQAIPRAAVIALAWVSRPAAESPAYSRVLTSVSALIAILQGVVVAFLAGWLPGMLVVASSYLITRLLRSLAYRYTGGVNRDALAYARFAVECCVLLILSVPLPAAYRTFAAH